MTFQNMRFFTCSSNKSAGKKTHPIIINAIIDRENLCIVWSSASSKQRIIIKSYFCTKLRVEWYKNLCHATETWNFDIFGSQILIQYKTALFGLRVWIFIQTIMKEV